MTVPAQPLQYDSDIASAAALIADSTRAAILQALLPDRPLAAGELARQLTAFPQTCLRGDRASVLEQEGLDEDAALAREFAHGQVSLMADTLEGATRFASGAGRHGTSS